MRSIQGCTMILIRSEQSGRFLLSRRAHLLTTPKGAVVLPAATVRSARRMRLLRQPYGQCHTSAELLSLSTQTAICFAFLSKQLFPFWKQLAACQ